MWGGAREDGAVKKNGRKRLTENERMVYYERDTPCTYRKHGAVIITGWNKERERAPGRVKRGREKRGGVFVSKALI